MGKTELISIVTATYNRSNVLKYTIKSVLDQSFENWELIIVGDCCTDDTEFVVNSFEDPRINFYNLEINIGEQSGPNNYGVALAQGEYIAFLNHDDLWFPDHLKGLYQTLKKTQSDLVYSLYFPAPTDKIKVISNPNATRHTLNSGAPASSWLFKKQLSDEIGLWKYFREIYDVPSQDWLTRVYRAKKKISISNEVSVIAIQSGGRKNVYALREFHENEYYYNEIKNNPDKLLKEAFFNQMVWLWQKERSILHHIKAIFREVIKYFFNLFGIKFSVLLHMYHYRRKGGFIDYLRQKRGLKKLKDEMEIKRT